MENKSDSNVSNGAPTPEANGAAGAVEGGAAKPVNPLRLARPLEKTGPGLVKTRVPASRPLPMPTISPLCPPGQKNGVKAPQPAIPASAATENEAEKPSIDKKDSQEEPSSKDPVVSEDPKVDSKEDTTDDPKPETKPEPTPVPSEATNVAEKEEESSTAEKPAETKDAESSCPKDEKADTTSTVNENGKLNEKDEEQKVEQTEKKEKDAEKNEEAKAPTTETPSEKPETPKNGTQQLATSPIVKKKADGPKIPVAEKTPRQTTKRKKSIETDKDILPERTSKRSRAPPDVFKASDPEMDHILKTIKKQEDEAAKKGSDKTTPAPEPGKKSDRPKKPSATQPASKTPSKTSSNKKRKVSESEESELEEEEESEEEDFKPVKVKAKKTPPKKPIRKSKLNNSESTSKKNVKKEPVFFK